MKRKILLQCKFFLVAFLNFSYSFVPGAFLSRIYLSLFLIKVGNRSQIHRKVRFFHIGKLEIGHDSCINFSCYLDNRRGIYIGNNVGIAHNTKIYTLGHDIEDSYFKTKGAPVYIQDNSFIFANCLIMPGVTIGEGSIILPGSVIVKDTQPFTIWGGNPARLIKYRMNHNIQYTQHYPYLFAL